MVRPLFSATQTGLRQKVSSFLYALMGECGLKKIHYIELLISHLNILLQWKTNRSTKKWNICVYSAHLVMKINSEC